MGKYSSKSKEWLKRYLPLNIFSTIVTTLTVLIVLWLTGNRLLAAYMGSLIDFPAYYGFILVRDVLESKKKHAVRKREYTPKSFMKDVRNIFLEFGAGEVLDLLFVRPFFLYMFPIWIGSVALGAIAGKYASDIIFYMPTIISYELRKKHLPD